MEAKVMTSKSTSAQPIKEKNRIHSLDIIRGIAVLGILIMNIPYFAYPLRASLNPNLFGFESTLDLNILSISNILVAGKFRGLFALLFGAGFYFLVSRLEKKSAGLATADIYFRRLVWLLIFGLIHAYFFLWYGDFLFMYAICGFFLFPLRNLSIKKLALIIVVLMALYFPKGVKKHMETNQVYKSYTEVISLNKSESEYTTEEKGKVAAWEKLSKRKPTPISAYDTEIKARKGGYNSNYDLSAKYTKMFELDMFYSRLFFENIIMMLIGLILVRLEVFTKKIKGFVPIMLGCLTIGTLISIAHVNMKASGEILKPLWYVFSFDISKILMVIGYVFLFVWISKQFKFNMISKALSHTGRMALTNYVFQSIICAFIFYGFGLGLFADLTRTELMEIVIGIWAFQIIFSTLWLRKFRFGPLEWLWRSLAYRKVQSNNRLRTN